MGLAMQNDETLPVEASQDAPEVVTEESSTPEAEAAQPETPEEKKSKGVQKRIDELTANWRNEQREKEWLRQQYEMLQQQLQQPKQPEQPKPAKPDGRPTIDQYADVDEYVEAVAEWKLRQAETEREAKARQQREQEEKQQLASKVTATIDRARQKYADFDDVVMNNPSLHITEYAAQAIAEMDNGADVAYHLGRNPAEAQRIAALSPNRQLIELGKIEASLSVKKAPSAPPPVSSQLAGTAGGGEPKDIKEWMAWRNAQLSRQK